MIEKNIKSPMAMTLLLMVVAYVFSVVCRLWYVYWASDYSYFFWNDSLMINTNDGYAFAEGARDMLAGFHQPNDLSFWDFSLSTLTYWIVKYTSIKIETVMIYLSVAMSSLVVIPVILIGKVCGELRAGFIGALLASVANSYYNRTMAGYYDTDMLIIVVCMFILWGLIRLHYKNNISSMLIAAVFMAIHSWWYTSSFPINLAIIVMFFIYTIISDRKNLINYQTIFMMLIATTTFGFEYKIILIALMGLIYRFMDKKLAIFISSGVVAVAIFGIFGDGQFKKFISSLQFYMFRNTSDGMVMAGNLHYFNVNQTIMEAGNLISNLSLFIDRISGNVVVFAISVIGYILLCFKKRIFLITMPMVGLGMIALTSGLRFTIYAVCMMAFGFGYFMSFIAAKITSKHQIQIVIMTLAGAFALISPLMHIYDYRVSTVFNNNEVSVLDRLKSVANREDYVISWWDYGYAIRYYSDVKTLIDGGKHSGKDNFAVSYALLYPQNASAKMAALEVEYTEKSYKDKFDNNLMEILKDNNKTIGDVNNFLSILGNYDVLIPQKTRDIFYFLPFRMMEIFPVVAQFSRLDLLDGKDFSNNLFVVSSSYAQEGKQIILKFDTMPDVIFNINDGSINIGNQHYYINKFIQTAYDDKRNLHVNTYEIDPKSGLYLVFMSSYAKWILMDENMFNSTYIQLFVLENYDKNLFEPIILDPIAKVYKLKR